MIVDAVHRHRVLSTEHIAKLFFPSRSGEVSSACRRRLRILVETGLLHRGEQEQIRSKGSRPYLFMLTSAGVDLLRDELGLEEEQIDWNRSHLSVGWPFLRHQLEINDVYVALYLAAREINWRLNEWIDDRFLRKQHVDRVTLTETGHEVAVVPDAYFVLSGREGKPRMAFFLEIDRATMSVVGLSRRVKSWQDKIRAYQAYFASDSIVERYGTRRVRVLTVTTGETRRQNLKRATEEVGGRHRYWFADRTKLFSSSILTNRSWSKATSDEMHAIVESL